MFYFFTEPKNIGVFGPFKKECHFFAIFVKMGHVLGFFSSNFWGAGEFADKNGPFSQKLRGFFGPTSRSGASPARNFLN